MRMRRLISWKNAVAGGRKMRTLHPTVVVNEECGGKWRKDTRACAGWNVEEASPNCCHEWRMRRKWRKDTRACAYGMWWKNMG